MSRATWKPCFALLALVALAGCASVPTEEVASADEAMEVARAAEAPDYAPEAWAAVEDHREQLETELAAQQEEFTLTRSYERARTLATETKELAEQAATAARSGKEKAAEDAAAAIAEATRLREEVEQLLEHAPRGKDATADLAVLSSDAGSTASTIEEAQRSYDAGEYLDAQVKAEEARRVLEDIKSQIDNAQRSNGGRA